ncbi:MAG: Gfo/Idh/MocA family oxidoreductase [Planctomycetaceae bacterium]|nr:Gfo/Idh/MocA family oxidoreductase [Planctomycetaceae bacterium]
MKRILIVGGGSIGERHLRCFRNTGRAEVSLCEIRDSLRLELVERYGLSETYTSLEEALAQPWDAGVICTPANWHIPMAGQFAEQSIGVLIEKPLSMEFKGIAEFQELAQSKNLPVSVAYVLRQHPGLAAMKQALDENRYGKIVQVVMVGGQHFPFYRPAYRETYYTKHETGGGAIQDALTHMMNAAEWLVGPVTRLVADAEHCVLDGVDVEDTVHILTRHGEVLGSFSLNQHQPANETTLTVICERGMVRWESHKGRWLSCSEADQPWTVEEEFTLERDDLFVAQADAYLDQLEGKRGPACSIEEGLQTLKVNLAALQSLKLGEWITL